jgi:hypothetical protein
MHLTGDVPRMIPPPSRMKMPALSLSDYVSVEQVAQVRTLGEASAAEAAQPGAAAASFADLLLNGAKKLRDNFAKTPADLERMLEDAVAAEPDNLSSLIDDLLHWEGVLRADWQSGNAEREQIRKKALTLRDATARGKMLRALSMVESAVIAVLEATRDARWGLMRIRADAEKATTEVSKPIETEEALDDYLGSLRSG